LFAYHEALAKAWFAALLSRIRFRRQPFIFLQNVRRLVAPVKSRRDEMFVENRI
jgi:hypothetical protein